MTKYLWHGSPRKLKELIPRQATGLNKKEDRQIGVYATDKRDRAIAMTLINLKGVRGGTRLIFPRGKVKGIVFEGWPTQEYFYLYTLPKEGFSKIDNWQWISKKKIIPLKIEKLKTKDYIPMIRKGTKKEKEEFDKLRKSLMNKQSIIKINAEHL
ncbi:MAG: hypothetical protein PVJ67_06510 [Candidatus Pacearchaeota archaeon]|jgi:hypothetical protein